MIPCTKDFTKETLFGRLEAVELDLKQSREFDLVKIAFSALNVKSSSTRNARA